ncbi:MAG: hypothetical protein IAE97_08695 [Chthoniobacterales bacterium]|nr:hypothetical protein [Chthoniobacterales bacterium]
MSAKINYWKECIEQAAEECGLMMTDEQLSTISEAAMSGHEYYGMAFYSPPPSDRYSDIEREWKEKLKAKEDELKRYQANAERAVKQALHQYSDANVSIGEYGEVTRWDGRATRIQ